MYLSKMRPPKKKSNPKILIRTGIARTQIFTLTPNFKKSVTYLPE